MSESNDGIQLEELDCSVCHYPFGDGDRTPRILICGHTFCTLCLSCLIHTTRPHCPDCRTKIVQTDVKSIPIAYIVKKIVESIAELNNVSMSCGSPSTDRKVYTDSECGSDVILDEKLNPFPAVGVCSGHNAPQQFWCERCHVWICGTCAFLEHSTNDKGKDVCVVFSVSEQFDKLKRKEILKLVNQKKEIIHAKSTTNNFLGLIHNYLDSLNATEVTEDKIQQLREAMQEKIDSFTEASEMVQESRRVINVETLGQLKSANEFINNLFNCQNFPQTEEELVDGVWSEVIQNIPCIIKHAENLVSSIRRDKLRYFAKMNVRGNYLVVSSFLSSPFEANFLIPYSEVKAQAKTMKSFLKIGINGQYAGTIQISLFKNKRAEQFAMLCTGERGPSYKGTTFFESKGLFTRYISGGDYEHNNGTAGAAVIDAPYEVPDVIMTNGIVCGLPSYSPKTLAQFKIVYEAGSCPYASYPIGVVEHGLDVVKKIAKSNYKKMYIEDCGVLVPLLEDRGEFCPL